MRTVFVALLALAMLQGCGRRGAPELPEAAYLEERVPLDPSRPDGETVPNRPFVLDRLVR